MKYSIPTLISFLLVLPFFGFSSDNNELNTINLNARAYLQGAITNSFETGETHGRPLMRDDLRLNEFDNTRLIPDTDVYQTPVVVTNYLTTDVTEDFKHVGCGLYAQYQNIPDPFTVFATTGENAIVDWVFVELRDANKSSIVVATRSGLLQRDGDIVDLDGVSPLEFSDVSYEAHYIAIRHRNHLAMMTEFPITPEQMADLVDFTTFDLDLYDMGTIGAYNYENLAATSMIIGMEEVRMMWMGDVDCDGQVNFIGSRDDLTILQKEVAGYDMSSNPEYKTQFNGAIGYLQGDIDMDGRVKFVVPDDDRNYLLGQVLFYPLNTNSVLNFNHILAQLPE